MKHVSYFCDACGKSIKEEEIFRLYMVPVEYDSQEETEKELCPECANKIKQLLDDIHEED